MRKYALLAALLVPSVAAVACTSILGDYAQGTGSGTKDAGKVADGGKRDGTTLRDGAGATDGASHGDARTSPDASAPIDGDATPTTDGGGDAPLPLTSCTEDNPDSGGVRLSPQDGGVDTLAFESLAIASMTSPMGVRVVVGIGNDPTRAIDAITYLPGNVATLPKEAKFALPAPDGDSGYRLQILDIERYATGFACLYIVIGSDAEPPTLGIVSIDDSKSTWGTPLSVAGLGPLAQNNGSLVGSLAVIDATTQSYYVAVFDSEGVDGGGSVDYLRAQLENGGGSGSTGTPLALIAQPPQGQFTLASHAIATTTSDLYLLVAPSAPGGLPIGQPGEIITVPLASSGALDLGSAPKVTPLAPTNDAGALVFPFGLANSAVTSGVANLGFLDGQFSLSKQALTSARYDVGQRPAGQLPEAGGIAWSSLPNTPVAVPDAGGIYSQLVIDHGTFHWEAPGSLAPESLLAIARTLSPAGPGADEPGVNFAWWTAAGALRGKMVGSDRLLPHLTNDVNLTAVSFNLLDASAPAAGKYHFLLAYELAPGIEDSGQSGPGELWVTSFTCTEPGP